MTCLREWLVRVWGSVYGGRSDRDLEEELRFHVESAAKDARRGDDGAGAADRARQNRVYAGGMAQSVELMRDQRGWPWLEDARRDLWLTFRMLTKARGFATVAILTLGLGIAASTVMFSVLNAVVLQPLPYRDPANLVLLWIDDVKRQLHQTLVPSPLYVEWKERSRAFSDLAFSTPNTPITLSGGGEAERRDAVRATSSVFLVLGVSPIAGRPYSAREERNGDRVAVIGRVLAERRFGSATAAVGQVLLIDGEPTTVIGVMPASFAFATDRRRRGARPTSRTSGDAPGGACRAAAAGARRDRGPHCGAGFDAGLEPRRADRRPSGAARRLALSRADRRHDMARGARHHGVSAGAAHPTRTPARGPPVRRRARRLQLVSAQRPRHGNAPRAGGCLAGAAPCAPRVARPRRAGGRADGLRFRDRRNPAPAFRCRAAGRRAQPVAGGAPSSHGARRRRQSGRFVGARARHARAARDVAGKIDRYLLSADARSCRSTPSLPGPKPSMRMRWPSRKTSIQPPGKSVENTHA